VTTTSHSGAVAKTAKTIVAALLVLASAGPAQSQSRADPIGELTRTATFNSAERVNLGKSRQLALACYFREEGSSHKADIGISRDGAFIRVDTGDGPLAADVIPQPPLKVFAGKALTERLNGDDKVSGEYQTIQIYDGPVDYRPNLQTPFGGGFAIVAKGDAKAFLATVVRAAPRDFMVVQSVAAPKNVDIIAIYKFKASTMNALLACAAKHIQK